MAQLIHASDIAALRGSLYNGRDTSQPELDRLAEQLELAGAKQKFRPIDKVEPLPLFSERGEALGTTAPRWMCHLLALRHRCAHILLLWRSPSLGDTLVLQIRDWSKDDSPGQLDISVGGHMTQPDSGSAQDTALTEMFQELSLAPSDLEGTFKNVGGYSFDEERPQEHFFNSEWRDIYIGNLREAAISKICFPDGEVAGLVLVPLRDAARLLDQSNIPIASALKASLPRCLEMRGR